MSSQAKCTVALFSGILCLLLLCCQAEDSISPTGPPSFNSNLHVGDLHASTAEDITLKCPLSGIPTPNITWSKDGQLLEEHSRVSFSVHTAVILAAEVGDSGIYGCNATNKFGSKEAFINVTVTKMKAGKNAGKAPQFYKQMANRYYIAVGKNLKLRCPTDSSPPPEIVWLKNGNTNWSLGQHTIIEDKLKLKGTTLEDSATYTCIVINDFGSVNYTFEVLVKYPGKPFYLVEEDHGYMHAVEGEDVTLACPIIGIPKVKIQWLRSAEQVQENRRITVSNTELVIMNANMSDTGYYQCIGNNSYGKLTINITLNVTEAPPREKSAPVFNVEMRPLVIVPAQNTIKLTCPMDAYPTPKITWLKNNDPSWKRIGGKGVQTDGKLKMRDALPHDTGNYTCIVENEFGSINYTFQVKVQERLTHRPIIKHIKPSENETVVEGSTVTFSCSVLSDLHPYVVWLRWNDGNATRIESQRDALISEWGEFYQEQWLDNPFWNCSYATSMVFKNQTISPLTCLISETLNTKEGSTDLTVEVLKFESVSVNDTGRFSCVASNTIGRSQEDAYLTVIPAKDLTTAKPGGISHVPTTLKNSSLTLIICVVIGLVIVIATILTIWACCRPKKKSHHKHIARVNDKMVLNRQYSSDSGRSTTPFLMARGRLSSSMTVVSEFELPLDPEWEFPRDRLTVTNKILGEGAFGQVVMGIAVGLKGTKGQEPYTIAVKMLKANATDRELSDLMSEMDMMKNIGKHVNIINMLGCCTQEGAPFVLVEYAPNGNLRDFLRMRRPPDGIPPEKLVLMPENQTLTNRDLLSMAYQVGKGMEFLASKKCIHRDLAARNVLVTEDLVMKIADFGLARDIHYVDYYKKTTDGRLPVKWMAPEALFDRVFTTESDVWSYGVLLWEIMTLGGTPYPSVPVEKMFDYLKAGKRMEQPQNCPLEVYHIMRETWQTNRAFRPNFAQLSEDLARTIEMSTNQEYLDLEALGDHPITTFLESEVDSGNSSSHSRHSSESTV
ncbi:fibroblast growth factor receptor-like [Anneissia japonica]|uniref:fibroblast growth factor receptor-like n=1 Tax=Anneissia japonica TaxID=1529436 RepID=UPI0014255A31|nr:fibroblast growth factor receptor-like [Anneissia japonica]